MQINNNMLNLIPCNHLQVYLFVSWQLAKPESLHQLGLPFENEYEMAKGMTSQ